MYEAFFKLTKKPFTLTADPSFVFLTQQHSEALAGLVYAILGHKGLAVLTGEAGTGKTTLLATALSRVPRSQLRSSLILNPVLTPGEFLEAALLDLGFNDIPASKAQRIRLLQEFLLRSRHEGATVTLIVDEAHVLQPELLEEIRLLGNFEYPDEKLLQIVLIGQPELGTLLNEHALRQFKQRVAVRLSLQPLSPAETRRYIEHRWARAGGHNPLPFDEQAIDLIVQASRGVPRLINSICDSALLTAFAEASATVFPPQVASALSDLDMPYSTHLNDAHPVAVLQTHGNGPGVTGNRPALTSPSTTRESLFDRWTGKSGSGQQNGR